MLSDCPVPKKWLEKFAGKFCKEKVNFIDWCVSGRIATERKGPGVHTGWFAPSSLCFATDCDKRHLTTALIQW